jgi:hypothetical protein
MQVNSTCWWTNCSRRQSHLLESGLLRLLLLLLLHRWRDSTARSSRNAAQRCRRLLPLPEREATCIGLW